MGRKETEDSITLSPLYSSDRIVQQNQNKVVDQLVN